MKQITYITYKEVTLNFNDDVMEVTLEKKQITTIINIDPFLNLEKIFIDENQITKIEGLYHLDNLKELYLSSNKISKIEGLDNLVKLDILFLSNNQISKIERINNLRNLQELSISSNKISKIEELENLINLKVIYLSSNQINKIEGLDILVNLQELYLTNNKINKIEGLDNLINLNELELRNNLINIIEGLYNLVNLQSLDLYENKIIEIIDPSQFTSCINLTNFYHDHNIYVHPIIIRLLNRNKLKNNKLHIFNDSKHISTSHNIIAYIYRFMKDIPFKEIDQTEFLDDPILTEKTKRLLVEYIDNKEQHSLLLLSFTELFTIIWQVIKKHQDVSSIKVILNKKLNNLICQSFTGRMYCLVILMSWFYPRVDIEISNSDSIDNIMDVKDAIHKELIDHGYDSKEIKNWIELIE